jgi:hypothetical protein
MSESKMHLYFIKAAITIRWKKNDTSEGKIVFIITIYTHIHTWIRKNENPAEKCFNTVEKCNWLIGKMIDEKEKCFAL